MTLFCHRIPIRHNFNFSDKISTIRTALQAELSNDGFSFTSTVDSSFRGIPLKDRYCVTVDVTTVEAVITKSACKFCELDPLPTWLLKKSIVELALVITSMIHASICNSCVPGSY